MHVYLTSDLSNAQLVRSRTRVCQYQWSTKQTCGAGGQVVVITILVQMTSTLGRGRWVVKIVCQSGSPIQSPVPHQQQLSVDECVDVIDFVTIKVEPLKSLRRIYQSVTGYL